MEPWLRHLRAPRHAKAGARLFTWLPLRPRIGNRVSEKTILLGYSVNKGTGALSALAPPLVQTARVFSLKSRVSLSRLRYQ